MDIINEVLSYHVSRETSDKIDSFVCLLTEWNQKMNLVSKNSLTDVWVRHVLDSAQLLSYLPSNMRTLVDIGSGAGFPAIVLAIMLQELNLNAKLILVESIKKKTLYLNDVCKKLSLNNVQIVNDRVENLDRITVFKDVDVVTARAVAALDVLCGYMYQIGSKKTKGLFLKGKSYSQELTEAEKKWRFIANIHQNKYSEDGVVLELLNLGRKK